MRIRHLIPSMYQRRLLLLMALGLLGFVPPALQMARLTLAKGDEHLAEAERRLVNEGWLETVRGRIIDRKGRVLALDQASFDIAVDYPVITGRWAYTQAARKARKAPGTKWAELTPDGRESLIQEFVPEFDAKLDAMWDRLGAVAGVSRADLNERRDTVRAEVQELSATVTEGARQRREDRLRRGEELTEEVKTADVRRPIREQVTPHVILKNVPEAVGFEVLRMIAGGAAGGGAEMIGVRVVDSSRRVYPLDTVDLEVDQSRFPAPIRAERKTTVRVEGVATHALGWMRGRLYDEDRLRRPRVKEDGTTDRGHYRVGDPVGQGGVEGAAEDALRGLRGVLTRHLDTDAEDRIPPTAGADVRVTLDAWLQARIQALFDPSLGLAIVQPWHRARQPDPYDPLKPLPRDLPLATPLSGAVVVLDVASGEVLAMVSAPSFPHRAMETGGGASLILGDEDRKPYLNRAIAVPYPPGSIVKPIILCGAMTAGKLGLSERIDCTGHFFPDKPLLYRCWIYKQFHTTHNDQLGEPPDGREAIQVSCNIFFFEAARRLGVQGVNDWYTRFGVGGAAEPWDLYAFGPHPSRTATETDTQWATRQAMDRSRRTLAFEYPGTVPDPEKATISEAILMGIGQGPIAWTPLHAADAYATIARGGVRLSPRLMAETPQKRTDLGIARAAIAQALAGLRASASEPHGTTFEASYEMPDGSRRRDRIFNTPGITIWAKSGTADSNPFKADYRDTGADETFDGDHAWCVYLAGTGDTPKYAVAVVVEHGGSGGRVAGPLANQVVQALVAEGYLPAVKPPLPEATTDAAAEGM